MNRKATYYVFVGDGFRRLSLEKLVRLLHSQSPRPTVWSARIGTGVLGLTSCRSGNRGPKSESEVLLALGDEGLRELIRLGFITCPVCNPEKHPGFWSCIKDIVEEGYDITTLADFIDKIKVPFDASRIDYRKIIGKTKQWPSRMYVPNNLSRKDLKIISLIIRNIGHGTPKVGYYDPQSSERFTEYQLE